MEDVASDVIAYLSMEIGIDPTLQTYSGGLGVLAGDSVRSAADLEIPMVAMTLVHRRGYFRQRLGPAGEQQESYVPWPVEERLQPVEAKVSIVVEDRRVYVGAWRYDVTGVTGAVVPVYFLDTDLPENEADDRRITDVLYGGDQRYRLLQEAVLGLGSLAMLRALGHARVRRFHMNEGHAALVVLGLVEERLAEENRAFPGTEIIQWIRRHCVFTTHTPVAAGHDRFPGELVRKVLGRPRQEQLQAFLGNDALDMTELGLRGSRFVNGVAMRHWQVSKSLFPGHTIHPITNGVHVQTWACPAMQEVFDRHLPNWRRDPLALRYAIEIPDEELWAAHRSAKRALIARAAKLVDARLDLDVFTLGFARRATGYKRADLLFHDRDRLRAVTERVGPLQLVFAGKAHPRDNEGKDIIRRIHTAAEEIDGSIRLVYLPDYDMSLGALVCSGVDTWLNNPRPPMEASGTSGMKAAINGVPSLSILDGWWVEGHAEGVTGWSIGRPHDVTRPRERTDAEDAASLYDKLEQSVMPCYYTDRSRFLYIMRHAIALNGSFFNTQRMMWQYLRNAYE